MGKEMHNYVKLTKTDLHSKVENGTGQRMCFLAKYHDL